MSKLLAALLLVTAFFGAPAVVAAAEEEFPAEEQASFLQRYTNAAQDVILHGLKLVGVRYRFGGNDVESGLDCSGFVRLVFKDSIGTLLPRTAREMSEVGQRIDSSDLKPGDLVFFNTM
ncbi:MAG: C40 family peptidase, partial [Betaproteobacteria bacterium]|nr:C40 family peptidase [Betaproteobacteria bacterium]